MGNEVGTCTEIFPDRETYTLVRRHEWTLQATEKNEV